jgi:hypothetical protein
MFIFMYFCPVADAQGLAIMRNKQGKGYCKVVGLYIFRMLKLFFCLTCVNKDRFIGRIKISYIKEKKNFDESHFECFFLVFSYGNLFCRSLTFLNIHKLNKITIF